MDSEEKRQVIIDFMKWKHNKIKSMIDVDYFTPEDEEDILGYSVEQIDAIWEEFKWVVHTYTSYMAKMGENGESGTTIGVRSIISEGSICPFCIVQRHIAKPSAEEYEQGKSTCWNCPYGKRHGFCDYEGSTYWRLTVNLGLCLWSLLGPTDIVEWLVERGCK